MTYIIQLSEHVKYYVKWCLDEKDHIPSTPMQHQSTTSIDFENFVMNKLAVVDKTDMFQYLLRFYRVIFLRPRRFGKSMILSTLKYFFFGATKLFKDKKVVCQSIKLCGFTWCPSDESAHNFPPCPVIHLDLSNSSCNTAKSFRDMIKSQLEDIKNKYCIPTSQLSMTGGNDEPISLCIKRLILELCVSKWNKWQKVVILVDEYDSILNRLSLDCSINPAVKLEVVDVLEDLFTQIKTMDDSIVFTYVTGITSFGIAGLFSGANNFLNLSHDLVLHSLCGFTESDVNFLIGDRMTSEEFRNLKDYFNGYSFVLDSTASNVARLFNPYAINLYQTQRKLQPFWSVSNTKSLFKQLPEMTKLVPLLPLSIDLSTLQANIDYKTYSINNTDSLAKLLFESGYLTVVGFKDSAAILDFPNQEIRNTVVSDFKAIFLANKESITQIESVKKELLKNDNILPLFEFANNCRSITSFYSNSLFNSEATWHQLISQILMCAEINFTSEQLNAYGRSDILLLTDNGTMFVIELKLHLVESKKDNSSRKNTSTDKTINQAVSKTAEGAIQQIIKTKYKDSLFSTNNKGKVKSFQYVAAVALNSNRTDKLLLRQFYYILQRPLDGSPDIKYFLKSHE